MELQFSWICTILTSKFCCVFSWTPNLCGGWCSFEMVYFIVIVCTSELLMNLSFTISLFRPVITVYCPCNGVSQKSPEEICSLLVLVIYSSYLTILCQKNLPWKIKYEEDCSNATLCIVDLISLKAARHFSCSFCDVSVNIWHLQFLWFWLDAVIGGAYGKGWMDVFWRHIGRVMCWTNCTAMMFSRSRWLLLCLCFLCSSALWD
jgi:hypothetical protein